MTFIRTKKIANLAPKLNMKNCIYL